MDNAERLAYHAEKTRREQVAWQQYQDRKARTWRARLRSLLHRLHLR